MPDSYINIASYRSIAEYVPVIGDFVIWMGMFSSLFGLVSQIEGDNIAITFESTPRLLVTQDELEMNASKQTLSLSQIRHRKNSVLSSIFSKRFYILQDGVWHV